MLPIQRTKPKLIDYSATLSCLRILWRQSFDPVQPLPLGSSVSQLSKQEYSVCLGKFTGTAWNKWHNVETFDLWRMSKPYLIFLCLAVWPPIYFQGNKPILDLKRRCLMLEPIAHLTHIHKGNESSGFASSYPTSLVSVKDTNNVVLRKVSWVFSTISARSSSGRNP